MKIKEIHVGITYPYQLAPYMYGRVELAELVEIEDKEDTEKLKREIVMKLREQCLIVKDEIVGEYNSKPSSSSPTEPAEGRRRRF